MKTNTVSFNIFVTEFSIFRLFFILVILNFSNPLKTKAQTNEPYVPSPENLEAREWFRDAKFGLFVHWGIYSIMGGGGESTGRPNYNEWIMNTKEIPVNRYEKLAGFFYPIKYDPTQWVDLAKKAGMKYITFTTKHHDGFAMYDSKVSDYDIVDASPYGRDIFGMLASACQAENIKLFAYYSHLDWHHPDYWPLGNTGRHLGHSKGGNWQNYLDYMNTQIEEIFTNYGPIAGAWFDGVWDKKEADWQLKKTYDLIHNLQPAALILNNHHQDVKPGEDLKGFERALPGGLNVNGSQTEITKDYPMEMCQTINRTWGFNLVDTQFKSAKEIIQLLTKAAGNDANLLLNVGPQPDGQIQPEFVEILTEVGDWLKQNGDAIYETRMGPLTPRQWGVSTQKENKVFIHVVDWPDLELSLPDFGKNIKNVKFLKSGNNAQFEREEGVIRIKIPDTEKDEISTIIVLEI